MQPVCTIMCLQMLRFEWDQAKNETNKAKHGIDFETAQLVFPRSSPYDHPVLRHVC